MGPRDRRVGLAVGLLIVFAFAPGARAATGVERYVVLGGVDAGDCSDKAKPCGTIQYAVDQTKPSDTVRIAAGTYVETVNWKNGSLPNLPGGVSIVGAGPGKTIVNGPAPCGAGAANTFFIGGTDVSLRSLSVGCSNIGVQAFGSVAIDAVEFLATANMNLDSGYGQLRVTGSTFHGRIGIGNRGADLTVVGSTFDASQFGVVVPAEVPALRLKANRFPGEGVAISLAPAVTTYRSIDLTDNWWGCNDGPGARGCSTIEGIEFAMAPPSSWLQLQAIGPPTMLSAGASVELTFGLVGSGTSAVATDFPPASVTFSAVTGKVQPASTTLADGQAKTTFRAPDGEGIYRLTAVLDNGSTAVAFNAPTPTPAVASVAPATPLPTPLATSGPPPTSQTELGPRLALLSVVVIGVALIVVAGG